MDIASFNKIGTLRRPLYVNVLESMDTETSQQTSHGGTDQIEQNQYSLQSRRYISVTLADKSFDENIKKLDDIQANIVTCLEYYSKRECHFT